MNCPNCNAPITFWVSLRQAMPHRFTCPRCRAKYRVHLPRMNTIVGGVVVLFVALTAALWFGSIRFGIVFGVPFFLLMVVDWLILEAWFHKYIADNGKLMLIRSGVISSENTKETPSDKSRG